jgi:AraC family transcriptional regulator
VAVNLTNDRAHRGRLLPWQARKIRDFIADSPERAVTLSVLAQLVGLSPFHFARAFKNSTGLPPRRYQIVLRIEKAKTLLATTGLSITDIAAQVGFDDPGYFARLFGREVGCTPREYRQNQAS